jgi:hypothetical protein
MKDQVETVNATKMRGKKKKKRKKRKKTKMLEI